MRLAILAVLAATACGPGDENRAPPNCDNRAGRDAWMLECVRKTDGSQTGWAFCECAWDYRAARHDCYQGGIVSDSESCAACYACTPAWLRCDC